jgi:two-component system, LytTR family, sensor kinase
MTDVIEGEGAQSGTVGGHPRTRWRESAGWIALFAIAAVTFAAQEYVARQWRGGPKTFGPVLLAHAIGWSAWGVLTPLCIVPLCNRFPIGRRSALASDSAVHVFAMALLAALQTGIVAFTTATIYYGPSALATRDIFFDRAFTAFALNALVYVVIVAVIRGRAMASEARQREVEAATLEARAARAELIALYGQLQPHFLFNALNGIAELTHSDPARAGHMIRSLGELLRGSIAGAGTLATTLRSEVEFVRRYVELQQMRFAMFEFSLSVDPAVLNAVVPPLLLQPLVENAIRHTVGRSGAGHASLEIGRHDDRLEITVRDDGPGFGTSDATGSGIGLSTTRGRLDRIFGDRYRMMLSAPGVPGAVVSIDIPYITGEVVAATS